MIPLQQAYPDHLAQVCNLEALAPSELESVLAATEVGEVWGVGRRISTQLTKGGIKTVLDLTRMDPATVRRGWSVVLERTVRELQGMPCIGLDDSPEPKKEIATTRSFGHAVMELSALTEAVSEFASRAAEKLRKQHSLAGEIMVFIRTSPFRKDPQYSRSVVIPLLRPSGDTGVLVQAAVKGLQSIYRSGFKYAKAGVMLLDLQPDSVLQGELDLGEGDASEEVIEKAHLMSALDTINVRFGKGTMKMASAGLAGDRRVWSMKQERRTPAYTTRWEDIPVARA